MNKTRCPWCIKSELEVIYHDNEWGVPARDDKTQFEFLTLEAAQAGLSWVTILKKREGYRKCFADFNHEAVARFNNDDIERLMLDSSIIRNRKKIESAIGNARIFSEMANKHGSFSNWFWNFSDGEPIVNRWNDIKEVPASTELSERIAKELKRLGFKFLGPTTIYAHMQATGMVNDHLTTCFRHEELRGLAKLR